MSPSTLSSPTFVSKYTFVNYSATRLHLCRELFRLTVSNFQSWFETSVIFWLHTFREECIRRTDKALEIDRDVVQVTAMVKYSNSSVDVLSCFTKVNIFCVNRKKYRAQIYILLGNLTFQNNKLSIHLHLL